MHPSASRDRSTITVTALSFDAFFEGRRIVGPRWKRSARGVVDADRRHATDPLGSFDQHAGVADDGVPAGHPRDPEAAGDRGHGGVVMAQAVDGPGDRSGAELGPRSGEGVLLGPGQTRTTRLGAAPDPLLPAHPHRPAERGRVMHDLDPTAVADGDDAAVGAAGQGLLGLHRDHDMAVVIDAHLEDVKALDTEQLISPRTACDHGPTPTVGHVRVSLLAAWSPPIVEALTPVHGPDTPRASSPSTTLNWEEPVISRCGSSPLLRPLLRA